MIDFSSMFYLEITIENVVYGFVFLAIVILMLEFQRRQTNND